jgi:cellulose synthase (UDP-forming)
VQCRAKRHGVLRLTNAFLALVVLAGAYGAIMVISSLDGKWQRPALCFAAAVGTGAYVAWRYDTAGAGLAADATQYGFTIGCLVLESIFVAEFWIFLLLCARWRERRGEADRHEAALRRTGLDELPGVDVFIATYDEEQSVLEKSIVGSLALNYPKFTVHVLDDGKRKWVRQLCERLGAHYIIRPDNVDKKAGNHNYALARTDAPFITVMDADFVPYRNFLWRTLGFFTAPDVGIVQTPQAFFNVDHFQNNLLLQRAMPDEQRFFFNHVMPCRDAWGVAFYCGSAAVLRRQDIDAIGGIVCGHATEDNVTSIAMLARGYRTVYLNEQLSWGLAPESSWAFLEQRKRWCRGGLQVMFRHDGPLGPAMRRWQERLFFLPTHWLFSFINPFYFVAIALVPWYFGVSPFFDIPPEQNLPATILVMLVFSHTLLWLGRGSWLPIISPAINLFQSFTLSLVALTTILKPFGRPLLAFSQATPKGRMAVAEHINWGVIIPLLSIFLLLCVGIGKTVVFEPYERPIGEIVANLFWSVFFMAQLAVASVAAMEVPYRRAEERFEFTTPALLVAEDGEVPCRVIDMSVLGAKIDHPIGPGRCRLKTEGEVLEAEPIWSYGGRSALRFINVSEEQRHRLISRLYLVNRTTPPRVNYLSLTHRALKRLIYP